MEPQDVGNFHFGYIGRAMWYDVEFLTSGAGVYQFLENLENPVTYLQCLTFSMCDDSRDTYYIRTGAIKYNQEN